jgi:DNA-binding beta-propeller fold protein YncE
MRFRLISSLYRTGSSSAGFSDGVASKATFNQPEDLALDSLGNIYVADTMNNAIRMIKKDTNTVITIAGKGSNHMHNELQ